MQKVQTIKPKINERAVGPRAAHLRMTVYKVRGKHSSFESLSDRCISTLNKTLHENILVKI